MPKLNKPSKRLKAALRLAPDGHIPLMTWCERRNMNYHQVLRKIHAGILPAEHVGGHWFMKSSQPAICCTCGRQIPPRSKAKVEAVENV